MSSVQIHRRRDPAAVEGILRSLPRWFGIEEAIVNYVDDAASLDSYLAVDDGDVIGVALVARHFAESAELSLIAVSAVRRGGGVGRQLVEHVGGVLHDEGAALLQVRTVAETFPDEGYAQTRAFYRRLGFLPLQEFDGLDWDGPTLIMVKPLASSSVCCSQQAGVCHTPDSGLLADDVPR